MNDSRTEPVLFEEAQQMRQLWIWAMVFFSCFVPGAIVIWFVRHYIAKGFAMGRV